jgi:hypothetical protein
MRLLRYSHIFASTVREILESKLLREASPLPLSLSQLHLLKLMTLNGRHQVGELAGFLGVSPPAATKSVDKHLGEEQGTCREGKDHWQVKILIRTSGGARSSAGP